MLIIYRCRLILMLFQVHSVVGPMAHSAADLRLFLTAVLNEQPWNFDSKVIPMPWRPLEEDAIRRKVRSGSLTLGFYDHDGNVSQVQFGTSLQLIKSQVRPHPPIVRAVNEVKSNLEKAGHKVLPWKPYKHDYASDTINGIYVADGCEVCACSYQ